MGTHYHFEEPLGEVDTAHMGIGCRHLTLIEAEGSKMFQEDM